MKRVKYIGKEKMHYIVEDNDMDLIPNKIYDLIREDEHCYILIDESGEDYAYPKSFFEIVEEGIKEVKMDNRKEAKYNGAQEDLIYYFQSVVTALKERYDWEKDGVRGEYGKGVQWGLEMAYDIIVGRIAYIQEAVDIDLEEIGLKSNFKDVKKLLNDM